MPLNLASISSGRLTGSYLQGVLSSRGKRILMADADGATKFSDVEKLERGLDELQPWPVSMRM